MLLPVIVTVLVASTKTLALIVAYLWPLLVRLIDA